MFRRSDYSDGTARKGTEFTGQSGKLPVEGITNNIRGNNDRKFDTLSTRAQVRDSQSAATGTFRQINRDGNTSALNSGSIEGKSKQSNNANTVSFSSVNRPSGTTSFSTVRYTETIGLPTAKKANAYHEEKNIFILFLGKLYGFFTSHPKMKVIVPSLAVCLLACIIIPIAVSAASRTDDKADFDLSEDTSAVSDIKDAKEIANGVDEKYLGSLSSDTTETETEKDTEVTDTETSEESESESEDAPVTVEETYTVTFMFYDRAPLTVISPSATLRDILANSGYYLGDTDKIYEDFDTPIESDRTVYIDRISYDTVTVTEEIPCGVQTIEVQSIPRGTTQTQSWGVNGTKDVVYNVEYVNGAEVSREYSYEYVVTYPQDQIDYYGTGGVVYAPDGTAYSYSYCIDVLTTYYNLTGNTATGTQVRNGIAAVDPSVFPLGSQLYMFNGYMDVGVISCEDTGVFGNIVDLWMDASNPLYSYYASAGIAYMTAYVLD